MDPIDVDARDRGGWTFPPGTAVVGADGDPVGEVVATSPFYLEVRAAKRGVRRTTYYIPKGAIANYDGDRITLFVAKAEADRQGWEARPEGLDSPTGPAG